MDWLAKEATEIQLHPNGINEEEELKLYQTWNPTIGFSRPFDKDTLTIIIQN
jgi:hypothetical protein